MSASMEIDTNVQRVVDQLTAALHGLQGGEDLTGAIGELLKITLHHENRLAELESRLRQLESTQR